MRSQVKRRLAGIALVSSIAGAGTAVGCSLGLDSSLLTQDSGTAGDAPETTGDGGPTADAPPDSAPSDARPSDSRVVSDALSGVVNAGECTKDSDCVAAAGDAGIGAGGCVTAAKCDTTWHVCDLTVCNSGSACQAEVCDTASNTCSLPATYEFAPASFTVQYGGVGPWGPAWSIAAAWPFVFVVTNNGVVAYDVVDPTQTLPPVVPVRGVPFLPSAATTVGRRVYFFTGEQGPGPSYHHAIAWVDVPSNPFLTHLDASSTWVSTTQTSFSDVLTDGAQGLFFVYDSPDALWDTADMMPPLPDMASLTADPNMNFPMGAGIAASSGSRLVTYRYDGTQNVPYFALVNYTGTKLAQATAEESIGTLGGFANQAWFATGNDGSVLWNAATIDYTDAGVSDGIGSSCMQWLLNSPTASFNTAGTCVPLETYSPATGARVVGPPGWIDANTALGLAAAPSNPSASTSVHAVTKSGIQAGKIAYLPVPPGDVGLATSNGFGYALVQNDPTNQTCAVYIIAAGCGGSDM